MKFITILLLSLIISPFCKGQIGFEPGYFIDNDNQKTSCLIKNVDWEDNPSQFEFKLNENSAVQTATIATVSEFGITNFSRYIRAKVKIDRSSEDINQLSSVRNPEFQEETLFLNVIIEGNLTLYFFKEQSVLRFFFSQQGSEINQLIYKSYSTKQGYINKNEDFKQQLFNLVQCEKVTKTEIERLKYSKVDLKKIFIKLNNCSQSEITNYESKGKRKWYNLTIRPGVKMSNMKMGNPLLQLPLDVSFDNQIGFRLGLENEIVLPFNKNKWSVLIEPTYQSFLSETTIATKNQKVKSEYRSIELPFAIRYSLFLGPKSRLFLNLGYMMELTLGSKIDYEINNDLDIDTSPNLVYGLGFNYLNKFIIELRHHNNKELLNEYPAWYSEYNTNALIIGYTLFSK